MISVGKNSKKLNALLMCHLPLLFAAVVLNFSLTQNNVSDVHRHLLTIIDIIGLSPLLLLLLSKFPLQNGEKHWLETATPIFITFVAILVQLKSLLTLLSGTALPAFGFSPQASLIPILILGEALRSLRPSLSETLTIKQRIEKVTLTLAGLVLVLNVMDVLAPNSRVNHICALILAGSTAVFGMLLFYLSRYRSENGKMLSILMYYSVQSELMSFFIPTFDASLNNSILLLGVIFALTIDSVFLRPEALVENGFSMSVANRRLREAYEKKISDSATLANATLDSLTARICILNSEGVVTAVNRAWKHFAETSLPALADTFIGQNYLHISEAEQPVGCGFSLQMAAGIRRVLAGQTEEFKETYPCHGRGEKHWYLCRVTRFETSAEPCAVVAHEDITELKRAEEELLLKTAAIERANDGIVLTDPNRMDHPVVYASPGFLKLTGFKEEEVLGRNCRFLQGPDTDHKTVEKIRQAVARKESFVGEITNYTKDGHAWINRLKLEPVFDENGHLLRYLGVQSNVTEQKRLESEIHKALEKERVARQEAEKHFQEAKSANTLKDEFLATLSHELRTPAGVIGGFVELLKYEKMNSQEQDEAIDAIERNARSLITLIDDILDVSRVITGKFKLNPKPVDLAGVVESVISAELLAAQAKNIRIVTEFEPGVGPVYGDVTRLQQIFWNLLSNAIKFTSRNGRVKVTLRMDGPRALVKITDTGVGIEANFLPHVFERFRQQDSGMNRTYGGLGLGLAIVKHLVEMHGGVVHAESAGLGRGSTFTVSLPVLTSSG